MQEQGPAVRSASRVRGMIVLGLCMVSLGFKVESRPMHFAAMAGLVTVMVASVALDAGQAGPSKPAPLKCEYGPVSRTFGGSEWVVYGCDDKVSLVVVSARGNPASPFYFFLTRTEAGHRIVGEGNGDEKASSAAGRALENMSATDLAELFEATKTPPW